jgi:hypothetical protein
VIDAQGPNLEVGKEPVDPGQYYVSSHLTDDMGITGDTRGIGIPGPTISLGSGFRDNIGGQKTMKAGGRIIGDFAGADAPGAVAPVLDLDRADNEHFAFVAGSAVEGDRLGFATASDLGFIHFDETGERAAPGASMLRLSLAQSSHAVL